MNTKEFQKQAAENKDNRYWALTCVVDGLVMTLNGNFSTVTRLFINNKLVDPDQRPEKIEDISKCLNSLIPSYVTSSDTP
jgi:hypothetical protein